MNVQTISLAEHDVVLKQHPDVWSPLSATEMLEVLMAQCRLKDLENTHVLDFGTGSGIIGILCGLLGASSVTMSDYCETAIAVATQNAQQNGLDCIEAIHSDRFASIPRHDYDLIISNPPVQPWLYTDLEDCEHRGRVEAWNEAGVDGRLVLDSLLCQASQYLRVGGRLITSSSSRHGHTKTQHLLETYWPSRWQQIYSIEHPIILDYHGPYLKTWQTLQIQDLDLRVYQKDALNRPFAYDPKSPGGATFLVEDEGKTTLWQQQGENWQPITGTPLPHDSIESTDISRMLQSADLEKWYYKYYLFEAVKD